MAKSLPFTPSAIAALRSGNLRDPRNPGLLIEATPGGKKISRYPRRIAGADRIHKATLGGFPTYTVPDAQEWARAINAKIERGADQVEAKKVEAKAAMSVDDAHAHYMSDVYRAARKTLAPRRMFSHSPLGVRRSSMAWTPNICFSLRGARMSRGCTGIM